MKILYLVNLNRNGNYSILLQCPGEMKLQNTKWKRMQSKNVAAIYGDKVTKIAD